MKWKKAKQMRRGHIQMKRAPDQMKRMHKPMKRVRIGRG